MTSRRAWSAQNGRAVAQERDPPVWGAALSAAVAQERDPPVWRDAVSGVGFGR